MTDYSRRYKTLATNLVHAGAPHPNIEGAVATPVFQSANYLMSDEKTYDAVRYIRLNNTPNHHVLHNKLAAIEGAESALVTSSGMAAISASILSFVKAGDHMLAQNTLYGGTQSFLDDDSAGLGFSFDNIDVGPGADTGAWGKALRENTKVIYVEGISNPLVEVGDLRAVVEFAKANNLVAIIDNTFATAVNFRPIEAGFDIVVHSATKYLSGHSDIVAGAVIGSSEHIERINHKLLHLGGSLDPHACFLLERGMKTLALRIERQNSNAQDLAEFLAKHPSVRKVNYPGLPDDASHENAKSVFDGFGGMLSFYANDDATAGRFLDSVTIPKHAASLGGVESLVVRPSQSSHLGITAEGRGRLGVTDDLIRVSVGIEDIGELIADFEQALS